MATNRETMTMTLDYLVRRPTLGLLVATLVVAGVWLGFATAPPALASTYTFSSFAGAGSAAGEVSSPQDVAVNDVTGNVYVADTGNQRIDEFDSSGGFVRAWGWGVADGSDSFETCTTSCEAGIAGSGAGQFTAPAFIAVDNSSGSSSGDVYVGDTGDDLVTKFTSAGAVISDWGDATPTNGQLSGASTTSGSFGPLVGIALGGGNLWVADTLQHLSEFTQTGTPLPTKISFDVGDRQDGLAVYNANVYDVGGSGALWQYYNSGGSGGALDTSTNFTGVSADPTTGDVYADAGGAEIRQYEGSTLSVCQASGTGAVNDSSTIFCTPDATIGTGDLSGAAAGVTFDPTTLALYVADPGANDIAVFTPQTSPPSVDTTTTRFSTSDISKSENLMAQVNPGGLATTYHFEYGTTSAYGQSAPVPDGSLAPTVGDQLVTMRVSGLALNTTYHFRVVASNSAGTIDGPDTIFDTGKGFGIAEFGIQPTNQDGTLDTQAGSVPYELTTGVTFNSVTDDSGNVEPEGNVKDIITDLPAGLIGNTTALPTCTQAQLQFSGSALQNVCPPASQVGQVQLTFNSTGSLPSATVPVYNMVPPRGDTAEFAFNALNYTPVLIDFKVRTGTDYGITATISNATAMDAVVSSQLTIWGVPGDPSHDGQRVCPNGVSPCSAPVPLTPLLRLPTSCTGPLAYAISADSYQDPGKFASANNNSNDAGGSPVGLTGCSELPFNPSTSIQPDTTVADSPSGLAVDVHVPQNFGPLPGTYDNATLTGVDYSPVATADLKDASVTLPAGVSINPSAAAGLTACTPDEIGLDNANQPTCPESSKIGSVHVDTPLLPNPLTGGVYAAQQNNNPFDSLLAIYVTAYDPTSGVLVKLAGHIVANPVTGQLETTFANNPQLPFTDFQLDFVGGPHGVLATPDDCGTFTSSSDLSPWSGGGDQTPSDSFAINSGCVSGFSPSFTAGTQNAQAGAYSPFVLSFSRSDVDQNFSGLSVKLPPGMLAKLAGVQECSDAALAAAAAETGAEQLASPSCPARSQVGTVETASGTGPDPFYLGGKAYLTGPYKGAPLGLAVVVPAVAGPYDLGTVVVRQALYVDPTTAQVTAVSDPFPTILQGIPLRIRRIDVNLNRPNFTVNPTSCNPMSIGGMLSSTGGLEAGESSHFQVGGCKGLDFKPSLKLQLRGATKRVGHPGLKAVVTYPKRGENANIARAQVNLPHDEFLDQGNLNKTCTKPILMDGSCPESSIYGHARAWTPLLEKPLEGNVYLVGGYGYKLPALVAELNGQLRVLLVGKVDTGKNHGIRNTFETVPDAPVSRFELRLKGGKKYGLLENSENICKKPQKAIANFTGQNGKTYDTEPVIQVSCGKGKGAKKKNGKS